MLSIRGRQWIRAGEFAAYGAGILLSGFFVSQLALGEAQSDSDISEFESAVAAGPSLAALQTPQAAPAVSSQGTSPEFNPTDAGTPDTTLWAPQRILDYQVSMSGDVPRVLGVLEVPSVGLKVPVYPSDSELNMDRGAGIIDGMAYPHEGGNIGISGHRDGYFRVLKDVKVGDSIVLQTLEGEKHFKIEATTIVEKTDTHLLKDTRDQTVTLVTCYPFYFVGHAPQRFIVTASLDTTYVNHN